MKDLHAPVYTALKIGIAVLGVIMMTEMLLAVHRFNNSSSAPSLKH